MNSVNINRLELLKIVRENLQKHIVEYKELIELYKKKSLEVTKMNVTIAKDNVKEVERGNTPFNFVQPKPIPVLPTCYEKEYNRAIRMLELSADEIINLEEDVFNQLVLDEWGWKQNFTTVRAFYKGG